jgi:hypothetical protein
MTDYSGVSNSSLAYRTKSKGDDLRKALRDANRDRAGAAARTQVLAAEHRELKAEMQRRGMR